MIPTRLLCIHSILFVLVTFASRSALGQPYVDHEENRYRFAQTYLGLDAHYVPGTGVEDGVPGRVLPRLTIGGIHFWGHADFYVTFPIPPTGYVVESPGKATQFSTGIETGGRYYPLRIESGRVSPFIGLAWSVAAYAQRSEGGTWGPTQFRHIVPVEAGLATMFGPVILEAGGSWLPGLPESYPVSRTEVEPVDIPQTTVWGGLKYPFETTLGAESADRRGLLDRIEARMDSAGQLNAVSLAIGPSAAFTLSESSYITEERPFLDGIPPSLPFPDIGLGFYSRDLDAAVNLAFRSVSQTQSGHGVTLDLERSALSLEAYKFLFDYNGFVPFVGASFGREWLAVSERDGNLESLNVRREIWGPGIVFGWDIRPTAVDWFTLRTNLRYAFGAEVATPSGKRIAFDQLEFNFIQFVLYPERLFDL